MALVDQIEGVDAAIQTVERAAAEHRIPVPLHVQSILPDEQIAERAVHELGDLLLKSPLVAAESLAADSAFQADFGHQGVAGGNFIGAASKRPLQIFLKRDGSKLGNLHFCPTLTGIRYPAATGSGRAGDGRESRRRWRRPPRSLKIVALGISTAISMVLRRHPHDPITGSLFPARNLFYRR
jgi:hypothetical protein